MSQTGKTTGNLKMRSGPGMEYEPPIAYLVPDTAVEILEEQGDWLHVKVEGKEGYVSRKYVEITGAVEAAPAPPAAPEPVAAPEAIAPEASGMMKKADQDDEEPVGPEIKKPGLAKREEPPSKTIGTGKDRVGGSLKDD
jgi:uncharacterized protein YraI